MKRAITLLAAILLTGCSIPAAPIPQGTVTMQSTSDTPVSDAPAIAVSSCDSVREAFLTGSDSQIIKALKILKVDKKADGTAREYADYYLNRDKGDKQLRESDKMLIRMSCGG